MDFRNESIKKVRKKSSVPFSVMKMSINQPVKTGNDNR